MDITASFSQSLASHNSTSKLTTHAFDLKVLNSFLQEAYRINAHISDLTRYLRSIRAPYLALGSHRATAVARYAKATNNSNGGITGEQSMSDADRKKMEADTKTLLATLSSAVRDLSSAATADDEARKLISARTRSKRGFGALGGTLGRWAAGTDEVVSPVRTVEEKLQEDKQEGIRIHREGVIWYLQKRLEAAAKLQQDMVAVRLQRAEERNKSMMYRVGMGTNINAPKALNISHTVGLNGTASASKAVDYEEETKQQSLDALLSPEQIQMFEEEQDVMSKYFNAELQKIAAVESSLYEISSLQTELSVNLELQSEHVSQLVADSVFTAENVGAGNKQLKTASERPSTARMVFWATCGLCSTLVVWDLIF